MGKPQVEIAFVNFMCVFHHQLEKLDFNRLIYWTELAGWSFLLPYNTGFICWPQTSTWGTYNVAIVLYKHLTCYTTYNPHSTLAVGVAIPILQMANRDLDKIIC
jgi:hypothetical protein